MDIQILPEDVKRKVDNGDRFMFLDVREPWEHDLARIEGAKLIPLGELERRVDELNREEEIIVLCHHGVRSFHATMYLRDLGFSKVQNLAGGIDGWSLRVDSSVPRYQGT